MPSGQGKPEGISSRVFCKVGGRTELLIVPDATQPVYLAPHFLRAPLSDQPPDDDDLFAIMIPTLILQPPLVSTNFRTSTVTQVSKLVDMVSSRFGMQVA